MADDGLYAALGAGFQGMGAVASPQVAQEQAQERANLLPNIMRSLQITNATRQLEADQAFQKEVAGKVTPGMTSSALLDVVKNVDPSVLATSPAAQHYLAFAGAMQQREALAEQRKQTLELARQRIDLEQQRLDAVLGKGQSGPRISLSPKDYTPESLKKYSQSGNIADLVAVKTATGVAPAQNPLGNDPDFWYKLYDITGKLPPMAWGAAGNPTREAFLKGFPQWKKAQGGGGGAPSTAAEQAKYKANASALVNVTKDLNTFEPYKKMLDTNADIAIQLGNKIYQSDAALANKPLNWFRQNATSNPDFAEYAAQMRFVQTEAARVINNPRIVGQLTDEARREMDQVISGNAPIPVVERVLNRLKTDGTNRFNAMRSQQADLIGEMKGDSGTPAPQQQKAPQAAIDYLKQHPETKDAFKTKYGYLP